MLLKMTIKNPSNYFSRYCWSFKISGSFKLDSNLPKHHSLQSFSKGWVLAPDWGWEDSYIHTVFLRAHNTDFMGDQMIYCTQRVVWTDNPWDNETLAGLKASLVFLNINQLTTSYQSSALCQTDYCILDQFLESS